MEKSIVGFDASVKNSKKEAFHWIVQILNKHQVPYQVSGGLAAKVHGSTRPLYDIDIEMTDDFFPRILDDVKENIVTELKHNKSETFEVLRLKLNFKGQAIDLTGTNERLYDKEKSEWINNPIDLSKSVIYKLFGIDVPVISKDALIAYKKKTLRDVDIIDIKEIERANF